MKLINKLMLGAVGGLVACVGMAEIFRRQVSRQIHGTSVFKEAVAMLRENKGARYLLGQPIETNWASFAGPGLFFTDHSAMKILVTGPKSKGVLFITAKPDKEENMHLDTVQLQVGADSMRRLVIKKASEEKS